jgi:hypothetical protein
LETRVEGVAVHTTEPVSVAFLLMLDEIVSDDVPSGRFPILPAETDVVPREAAKTATARTTRPLLGARILPDCRDAGRGADMTLPSGEAKIALRATHPSEGRRFPRSGE